MSHPIVHFAIHADDVERARRFYEQVFGWTFRPWGPPEFYMIATGPPDGPGIHGSLQRRQQPVRERSMIGFECTVAVQELGPIAEAVREHGGKITTPETVIPGVGTLIQLEDTEGNVLCAMRYEEGVG